jgi:hypothetical protein
LLLWFSPVFYRDRFLAKNPRRILVRLGRFIRGSWDKILTIGFIRDSLQAMRSFLGK